MDWKTKAIAATSGTQLGAIIACALNRTIEGPIFVGKASITSDGFVMCNFKDKNGNPHFGAFVGSMDDMQRNAVGLAEHLKLTSEERTEYASALDAWLATDYSGKAKDKLIGALK